MLITLEQVLSKDEVAQFRRQLDQADWQDGAATAGTLARHVKQNQQLDDNSELCKALGKHILRALGGNPAFVSAALAKKIYPPKFNRYAGGGTYGAHVDSAVMQLPGTGQDLRSDLSATLFLAEPDEYEGGELEIENRLWRAGGEAGGRRPGAVPQQQPAPGDAGDARGARGFVLLDREPGA